VADSFDHRASSGLRYIVNPPGSTARIHQHLDIGQGEVDWDEFFGTLGRLRFDGIMTVCVFAWEDRARESSIFMREQIEKYTRTGAPVRRRVMTAAAGLELLTVGRVSADLYPDAEGHPEVMGQPLERSRTSPGSLGGTATNVAGRRRRLGRRSAVLTKVGPDPFGRVRADGARGLRRRPPGSSARPRDLLTPVVFCALDPPEDPPLLFYRRRWRRTSR
jgi:hypothetical protein